MFKSASIAVKVSLAAVSAGLMMSSVLFASEVLPFASPDAANPVIVNESHTSLSAKTPEPIVKAAPSQQFIVRATVYKTTRKAVSGWLRKNGDNDKCARLAAKTIQTKPSASKGGNAANVVCVLPPDTLASADPLVLRNASFMNAKNRTLSASVVASNSQKAPIKSVAQNAYIKSVDTKSRRAFPATYTTGTSFAFRPTMLPGGDIQLRVNAQIRELDRVTSLTDPTSKATIQLPEISEFTVSQTATLKPSQPLLIVHADHDQKAVVSVVTVKPVSKSGLAKRNALSSL